jgi:hypothetical protein
MSRIFSHQLQLVVCERYASGFSHSRPAAIAMAKAGISLRLDHQLKLVAKKTSIRNDERVV